MKHDFFSQNSNYAARVIRRAEKFWESTDFPPGFHELLRFSTIMGIFPFSGFLLYYTLFGRIWNWYPFIRTTLPVTRALMCAGLQWVFFLTFPLLSSLVLDLFSSTRHSGPEFNARVVIATYSMTPLFLASLFVGVPFVSRVLVVLAFSTFVYLLFYGYRAYAYKSLLHSAAMTFIVTFLFALIRQMFVFVIGF